LASELRYVLGVDGERAAAYIDERVGSPSVLEESIGGESAPPWPHALAATRRGGSPERAAQTADARSSATLR
jgi:hypothetical protein